VLSTNRAIDLTITQFFPHHLAAAWRRTFISSSDAARKDSLLEFFAILLETLGSYFLLDYMRGADTANVRKMLADHFGKPSLGNWVELAHVCLVAIRDRKEPEPFFPEALDWYFDPKGKQSNFARKLVSLVERRNEERHGEPSLTDTANKETSEYLQAELRAICDSLSWLRGYRLFRVQGLRKLRVGKNKFRCKASFFVGVLDTPIPESVIVGQPLVEEAMYLAAPTGDRLLEVTPFLRMRHDTLHQDDRLFLFKQIIRSKKLLLRNPNTGSKEDVLVEAGTDEDLPFDQWTAREYHSALLIENEWPDGLRATDVEATESGCLANRFQVRGPLGEGGMAVVHHVYDEFEDEELALKLLRPRFSEDEAFQERFRREAKTMRRLEHPNLLQVIDMGTLPDGRAWLTMPIVAGGNLRDRLKEAKPSPEQALAWMEQMLCALVYLHERKKPVIHRDIKLSNFLVDNDGTLLLTDFGIALQEHETRLTSTNEQVGSMAFMSPEQRRGGDVGPSSDIYSLGIVFHMLLTGEEAPRKLGGGISGKRKGLVLAMTQEQPRERPSTRDALEQVLALGQTSRAAAEAEAHEAERKQKQEAERKQKQEVERKQKQEVERKQKQEAERKQKQEAERKQKQEAFEKWKRNQEAELKRKQEAELKQEQEAELKRNQEAELKRKQEAELKRKQEAELKQEQEAGTERSDESERKSGSRDVVLVAVGSKKISVVKAVRSITGLDLRGALETVDRCPSTIKEAPSEEEAAEIMKVFEEAGATVELKTMTSSERNQEAVRKLNQEAQRKHEQAVELKRNQEAEQGQKIERYSFFERMEREEAKKMLRVGAKPKKLGKKAPLGGARAKAKLQDAKEWAGGQTRKKITKRTAERKPVRRTTPGARITCAECRNSFNASARLIQLCPYCGRAFQG